MSNQVIVLNTQAKREQGRKAQLSNIAAVNSVSQIVQSTLGPRSMLKMMMDPMGGIVMTSDGNAILREITAEHPAAKSAIELCRAQDEEVGDGTTSVIILAGELMSIAKPYIEQNIHPSIITKAYSKALRIIQESICKYSQKIDTSNDENLLDALNSCLNTKFTARWGKLISQLAIKASKKVYNPDNLSYLGLDITRYAKIEKIPGGSLEDSVVLDGVIFNKDITHPQMRRKVENCKILLLDCPLEYKKGESQTTIEMKKNQDMSSALQQEMEEIAMMCNHIVKYKPDLVITEKGVSDLAQHFLLKNNISCIRRIRKTDNVRVAKVSGATIVSRPEEITEEDIGQVGLFEIKKIGDEYFTYLTEAKSGACSIILRGASKDVLNEMERNLHDCLAVCKNLLQNPEIVCGGGCIEMQLGREIVNSNIAEGLEMLPFKAIATALEIIPKILIKNSGQNVIRTITELRSCHKEKSNMGIEGIQGKVMDMTEQQIWESVSVKKSVYQIAINAAIMLLRIDDIVSGIKIGKKENNQQNNDMDKETFGDARDG